MLLYLTSIALCGQPLITVAVYEAITAILTLRYSFLESHDATLFN